jgi:hypothetical protein
MMQHARHALLSSTLPLSVEVLNMSYIQSVLARLPAGSKLELTKGGTSKWYLKVHVEKALPPDLVTQLKQLAQLLGADYL